MLRKMVCAAFVVTIGVSFALAEEFTASIRKVEDGKITVLKFSKDKDKKGEESTLTLAANVKVVSGKFNKDTKKFEAGDALPDGLKNERFQKIGEKGVFARIITDGDNKVTEIRVIAKKKTE